MKINRHKGLSLIELTLVIVITSSFLMLVTRYFSTAMLASNVAKANDQVLSLWRGAQTWAAARVNYCGTSANTDAVGACINAGSGVTLAQLASLGYVPEHYVTKGSPWQTPLTLTAISAQRISISINSIPSTACAQLQDQLGALTATEISCTNGNFVAEFN